jgi:hypothetical protein
MGIKWGSRIKGIDELINSLKFDTHTSDIEETIEELAWDFSCIHRRKIWVDEVSQM